MKIDRRDALAGIAAMFGASMYAPLARALASDTTPISSGPPSVAVFTSQQRALMTALSERVMPTTDTPGAIAAGVPEFIEKLLADWASPDERKPILAGLDAIEVQSRTEYKVAADKAYQNAMKNSDKQNARIEHDKALARVMTAVLKDDTELFKQFMDNESFRRWLTDTVFGITYDRPTA